MHIPAALHHAKTHIQLCTRSKRTFNSVPGRNAHSTLYQVKTYIQLCTRSKRTFNSLPGRNASHRKNTEETTLKTKQTDKQKTRKQAIQHKNVLSSRHDTKPKLSIVSKSPYLHCFRLFTTFFFFFFFLPADFSLSRIN